MPRPGRGPITMPYNNANANDNINSPWAVTKGVNRQLSGWIFFFKSFRFLVNNVFRLRLMAGLVEALTGKRSRTHGTIWVQSGQKRFMERHDDWSKRMAVWMMGRSWNEVRSVCVEKESNDGLMIESNRRTCGWVGEVKETTSIIHTRAYNHCMTKPTELVLFTPQPASGSV